MILATLPRSLTLPITDNSRHSSLLTSPRMCQAHPASRPSCSFFHLPGLRFPSSLSVWLLLNLQISPSWKTHFMTTQFKQPPSLPPPIILYYITLFISFPEISTNYIHVCSFYDLSSSLQNNHDSRHLTCVI